jgi:hypothetical protein
MRFEIQGNNVSFRTEASDINSFSEDLYNSKKYLPVDIVFANGKKTFYVELSDRLERIKIIMDDIEFRNKKEELDSKA